MPMPSNWEMLYDLRKKKQHNFPKLYFVEKINHFNNFKEDKSCTKQVQPVIAFRNITGAITRQYMIEKLNKAHKLWISLTRTKKIMKMKFQIFQIKIHDLETTVIQTTTILKILA